MACLQPKLTGKRSFFDITADDLWDTFDQGLQEIYSGKHLSNERYLELYTFVHNYCAVMSTRPDAKIIGRDLYKRIKDHLEQHVFQIDIESRSIPNDELFKFYDERSKNYKNATTILNKVCDYLNRHWIRWEKFQDEDIVDIKELAMAIWTKHVAKSPNRNTERRIVVYGQNTSKF